jgi:hypothetical protein
MLWDKEAWADSSVLKTMYAWTLQQEALSSENYTDRRRFNQKKIRKKKKFIADISFINYIND